MKKNQKYVYYAPGLNSGSVNSGVILRLTDSSGFVEVELVQGRRSMGTLRLESDLHDQDPTTVGFRRKLDKLATALNMRVESNIPQLSSEPLPV